MIRKKPKLWSEDRLLLLIGAGGLALTSAFVACSDDDGNDTGSPSSDAGVDSGGSRGDSSTAADSATTTDSATASDGSTGSTADCTNDPSTATNTAAVVTAANAWLAALTTAQQTTAKLEKTLANARKWSNFPTTFVTRNGVKLADMSADAQTAAIALAEVAAGSEGARLLSELRAADEWLVTDGKASSTDYGAGLYYFSVHGTPSTSDAWMLQIGGHHLAYNFMYNGACTSATPLFDGSEPMDWTDSSGTAHAPVGAQRTASVALLASISSNSEAKLSGTFSDLVNGPSGGGGGPGGGSSGGGDSKYPSSITYPTGTTGRGVNVGTLTSEQKALVKAMIESWVTNVADPVSSSLLALYESDAALAETYVGYSGSADLSTQSSYIRVDGPRVWIEASVQSGVIYRNIVHYHTIWRDKVADYGAEFVSQ